MHNTLSGSRQGVMTYSAQRRPSRGSGRDLRPTLCWYLAAISCVLECIPRHAAGGAGTLHFFRSAVAVLTAEVKDARYGQSAFTPQQAANRVPWDRLPAEREKLAARLSQWTDPQDPAGGRHTTGT